MSNDSEPIIPTTGSPEPEHETLPATIPSSATESLEFPPEADELIPVTSEPTGTGDDEKPEPENEREPEGMGFLDHLEELRWRLIKSAIALLVGAIASGLKADFLVNEVLIGPLKRSSPDIQLQNLVPYGQVSIYFQVILFSAFVLAFPFLAWQIWKFVEPGLHETERKASRFVILFISICFFSGIAFGYFVFLPISLNFFAGFGSTLIRNNIAVQDYISFFLGALLTTGIVFELPFISYVFSKTGLLTPAFMRFYRRHAVITLLVIAAIVTPSTDMVTQMVIAIPLILLYEVSIYISAAVQKNRNKQLMQEQRS
ncbi:MAG: twin-arginine translocase subunit TatC [Chlorobiaceae bacterium]|nr:twin-arginine translocase subunit TatC [Chlorobiaceae bacterium]